MRRGLSVAMAALLGAQHIGAASDNISAGGIGVSRRHLNKVMMAAFYDGAHEAINGALAMHSAFDGISANDGISAASSVVIL